MEVKLFLADAGTLKGREPACFELLTPRRREEVMAFREESDRLLHCAAGLMLRRVLGVTGDEQLTRGAFGKPALADGRVQFSLSHAGRCAALAISDRPVGVDVEPVGLPPALPRRALRREELDWLEKNLSGEGFALLWTRLESALKAEGLGLTAGERRFSLLEEGAPWHWQTLVWEGHTVTCAGEEPLAVRVERLSSDALLNG